MPVLLRALIISLRALLVGVIALIVLRALLCTSFKVTGASMRETLQHGDHILVCELPLLSKPVHAGDTVIVDVHDEVLVKRVMAVPGDTIAMERGKVLRNGRPVRESIPPELNCDDSFPTYRLRTDEYFLLGDHRRVSVDSRDFGPVGGGQVLGRVVLRVKGLSVSTVAALEREPD
jgi:signal peptidase I